MDKRDKSGTPSSEPVLSNRTMKALGLNQQPFSSTILSDKSIYTDSILNKQYETLKHHLQFSDLILVVEGVFGSGKTTLFRRLLQLDIASLYLMPIQAEATDTLVQVQQKMSIHMQDQGNANYLDDNLKNLQVFDQTPVLIIDDAHVLSDITLQELLRYKQQLAAEKDTQLKLMLLANKGMAKTLEQISDLDRSQIYVQEMPKFSSKQILAFIGHRLKLSGAETLPQLDQTRIQKLAKKTDGIPAQVMAAAADLFNSQRGQGSKFSLALPSRPLLIGSGLIALLAVAGWLLYPVFSPKMADLSKLSLLDNTPMVDASSLTEASSAVDDMDHQAETDISDDEVGYTESLPAPNAQTQVQPVPEDNPAAPVLKKMPLPAPQTEPLVQPTPQPAPRFQPAPEDKPVAATPIANPALITLSRLGIKDQDWLLQQNKDHWTLQVLGARDPQTLVNFIQTHHLEQDTAWYKSSLNGADWYVLVHRFYTDRNIARNSISRLPASLRQARPWVRSIDSIHKAVN